MIEIDKLEYKITRGKDNWNSFRIYNEGNLEVYTKGKIEIVNQNRIRIYHFKYHEILDLADEYYRTNDLNSFSEIMKIPEK